LNMGSALDQRAFRHNGLYVAVMLSLVLLTIFAADPSLTRLRDEDARVAAIAWRLQTASASMCPNKVNLSGLSVQALSQYPKIQRAAAKTQLGLGRHVAVAAIVPDSPAARVGLTVGDAILAINGMETPVVLDDDGYTPVGKVEDMLDAAMVRETVKLRILRAGAALDVVLQGRPGCPSRVQIISGKSINAGADGQYVQINSRMLDFVQSDDELAVVVGHELAHNIRRHKALRTPSKQAEYEADALGAWLVARAGYDVKAILPFWTRFEDRTNAGIFADGTHPPKKKRLAAIAAVVADINGRQGRREPLDPPSSLAAQ
jgi:beta-barrel assembly-enhancing protease